MHEFLAQCFGDAVDHRRRLALFTLPDKQTCLFNRVDDAAEYGTSRAANSDVYFGVGVISGSPAGRGKSEDVSAIGALWADIDIHSAAHVSDRLPGSLDEARDLLRQLPLRPSILVSTGHGLHAYWLLHEPWIFESPDDRDQAAQLTKSWHGLVCAAATRKGWSLENLGDLTRVLRLPGTINHRDPDAPANVELIETAYDRRYDITDFEEFLPIPDVTEVASMPSIPLTLLPEAEPPSDKLILAVTESPQFLRTWEQERSDLRDQSPSGYDLSLAVMAALREWSDQEIANLLIARRRRHDQDPKKALRLDYIQRTIVRARSSCPEEVTLSEVDLSGLLGADEERDQGPDAIRNPGPFPMELISTAPAVVQRAMDYYWECAIEAQPVLFLASLIAATGAVLGHRVKDRSGLRTNIYTVGLTGTGGGKEATRETMFRIFQHAGLETMCGQEDFASDAGLISAVVEQNPILFQIDEFGRFMHCVNSGPQRNPHAYNIASVLLKFYSKANSTFRSKAYADAKRNQTILQPHVCLYGTSVATNFWAAMDRDSLEGGFLPRILIFEGDDEGQPGGERESDPPHEVTEFFAGWGNRPSTGGNLEGQFPRPIVIPSTEAATRLLNDLRAQQKLQFQREDGLGVLWSRARENAGKLAMIYACWCKSTQPVIDETAADWAIRLTNYLIEHMVYQAQLCVAESPFHQRCQKIMQVIERRAPRDVRHRELTRLTRGMTPRDREEAIDALLEQGRLRRRREETPGRTALCYSKT